MTEYNEEMSEEEIEARIAAIPEPPVVDKRWNEMTQEEQELMRDYYDSTDFSALMEKEGEWVDPNEDLLYPLQLELDLGVVPIPWDENTRYSEVKVNLLFDYELTTHQYNRLVDVILDALDEHFPCDFMSARMRSGTDMELFPEAYDESEESDGTEQEKM